MKLGAFIIGLVTVASLTAPQQRLEAANRTSHQRKLCTVESEEIEIFVAYMREETLSPHVVVTRTAPPHVDVDGLNLQLAAQGRGIPPDVRADFNDKNKSSCAIKPFGNVPNLHFLSQRDHDLMFRKVSTGWSEFHKTYGKEAEILFLSRIGFNNERTLALVHVSSGMGGMAGSGTLYLFERKNDKWVVKSHIQTWIS